MNQVCRIHDLLEDITTRDPGNTAVVDGEERLSYRQISARVDAVAKALIAAGVEAGDRVGTLAPPGLDFWVTYLASVSVGAIWHGLNPVYRAHEFEYLLADAAPVLVFSRSPYDGRHYDTELQAAGPGVRTFVTSGEPSGRAVGYQQFLDRGRSVADGKLKACRDGVRPEDTAVIVYTSGTTGQPKGAMLSHAAITRSAIVNAEWMAGRLASTVCAAPINHVGALNNVCMNVFAAGGRIIFHPRVDIPALGRIREQEKPAYMVSSPTGFMMTMSSPGFDPRRLSHTQLIVCGGAATPLPILETWAPVGCPIVSVYGQTETCGIITHTDIDAPLRDVADTIGRPLPGCECRVARPDNSACDIGEPGELQFRGPYVMSGYFGNPVATDEAFTADGFLRTGDLGLLRPDGNLVFVGRFKEMFKSGGYNVYPLEIEQAIASHEDVLLAAVLPVPHPLYQEVGHAFVMPKPGHTLNGETLRIHLKSRMANYKVPKTFSIETELPLLPNGKIDRQNLKARLAEARLAD